PLIFNGVRCANSVCLSLNSPDAFDPSVKELVSLAKKFGTVVGPYNLTDEARKKEKDPREYLL
ncbi:MAG: hypothetical protein LBF40_00865, partial [Deltaproteobacteria bacterium]|nr:hypothetical protein [Deltaproteobacteria bacterium]